MAQRWVRRRDEAWVSENADVRVECRGAVAAKRREESNARAGASGKVASQQILDVQSADVRAVASGELAEAPILAVPRAQALPAEESGEVAGHAVLAEQREPLV
jgi:hypothetical protein